MSWACYVPTVTPSCRTCAHAAAAHGRHTVFEAFWLRGLLHLVAIALIRLPSSSTTSFQAFYDILLVECLLLAFLEIGSGSLCMTSAAAYR